MLHKNKYTKNDNEKVIVNSFCGTEISKLCK